MSPERIPEVVPIDPESTELPPELDDVMGEVHSPVLLLVPDDDAPASRTAIALAEGRASAGHATVLADVGGGSDLHALLDVDNGEGMADVFLYGASPGRVRTRPPGRSFDFIPTGAYLPPDPTLLDDDRWGVLADDVAAEGATLLVFATPTTPGLEAVSRRLGKVVLIGDPADLEGRLGSIDPSCEVVAVVTPAPAAGAPFAPDGSGGETEPETWTSESEEPPARAAAAESRDEELEGDEPTVVRPEPEHRRAVSPVLWVLLVLALAAGAWFVYTEYVAAPTAMPAAAETESARAPAERGDPVETALPVSVAIEAHPDLPTGLERVAALRSAEPELQFYLAPVDVDGVAYYRLLAGPVADRASAEQLMDRLMQGGHITAAESWAIQDTPLAFALGEYDSAAAAAARVDSLAGLGIPAYTVEVRYETGPRGYRVYGGAYETAGEAAILRRLLSDAGIEAELVARTGETVSGS